MGRRAHRDWNGHGRSSLAHRLYFRIYLALLASLALFALAVALAWRLGGDQTEGGRELASRFAQNVLPAANLPAPAQQQVLERLTAGLGVDAALYAPDGARLASVGTSLAEGEADRRAHGLWSVALDDGRRLVVRPGWQPRGGFGFGAFALLAILLAVALAAYPVVRKLTRRLERLQAGVESLGSGDLSARVKVQGRDEVAQLAESFNRAAARIEDLVTEQKNLLAASRHFFATASHELRTPLSRIRMAVELARDGLPDRQRADLEGDIGELDALIDEILEAARLESRAGRETDETVDLLALAAEECAHYDEAELDGEPVVLQGDARLLRRLIRNLLENARRHGAPPVGLRVSRAGTGAEITVTDRGPGVPEADRERVFEPFYRAPGSRAASGYGLGLALVRRIAERHGGEAACLPLAGGGTRFRITLGGGAAQA